MLKKTKKGYYVLEKLAQQEGLIHGFSTRKLGDMRAKKSLAKNQNIDNFLKIINLEKRNLVLMEQIHGNKIKATDESDKGLILPGVDGMSSVEKGIILGVKTADCLPILFYDSKERVIGVAHAGWKGVLKKVGQKLVEKMKSLGCRPKNILVGIGPHVGPCCYTVSKERADKFEKEFGNLKGMIAEDCGGIHLDLAVPMIVSAKDGSASGGQLIKVGIRKENIDLGAVCTACQKEEFFSYRKDTKETFGEMLGIIGLIN